MGKWSELGEGSMRILALCSRCHTQYDVSGRTPGEGVRCHCGAMVVVPAPRDQEAKVVRCPNCGAARSGDIAVCEFCSTRFSPYDRGWGLMCPACFCRLPNDARFCVECSLRIQPQRLDSTPTDLQCPRCALPLHERHLQQVEVSECGTCGGIWLSVELFQAICRDQELMAAAASELEGPVRFHPPVGEAVHYIPCLRCGNTMNRQNFARVSGVIMDVCRECGVWLDDQELNHVLHFLQSGGMARALKFETSEHLRHLGAVPAPTAVIEKAAAGPPLSSPGEQRYTTSNEAEMTPLLRLARGIARWLDEQTSL